MSSGAKAFAGGKPKSGTKVLTKPRTVTKSYNKPTVAKSTYTPASYSQPKAKTGGKFSTFDNQWHPTSWYAPKPKVTTPTPDGGSRTVSDKGSGPRPIPSATQAQRNISDKSGTKSYGGTKPIKLGPASHPVGTKSPTKVAAITNRAMNNIRGPQPGQKDPTKVAAIVKNQMGTIKRLNTPANRAANMGKDTGQSAAEKRGIKYVPPGSTNTGGGTRRPTGGGSGSGGGGTAPKPTVPKPAPKPVPTAPKPPPVVAKPSPHPQTGGKFEGRGQAGKFGRRRGWGPRAGLSITPEMLASIAKQRIVNYR